MRFAWQLEARKEVEFCHTWLLLGVILSLSCFHGIQHGICILAVLLRSVCGVQGSVCPVLVSVGCEAVCMDMLWLPGCP